MPLINLAITTSGANLSTTLPATVSPSRLLQASTFLTAGDTKYAFSPEDTVQIGPTFTLSMYMLFSGHGHRWQDVNENVRETTWKEVIHKARVKIRRTPLQREDDAAQDNQLHFQTSVNGSNGARSPASAVPDAAPDPRVIAGERRVDEFSYEILIIEDLHDDRVHSFDEDDAQPGPYDEVELAGIREIVPIYQVSKIFYADTGKILNIGSEGEVNNPVLLLKRDPNAIPPRRMEERRRPQSDLPEQASYFVWRGPTTRTKEDDEHARLAAQFSRESPDVSFVATEDEEEDEPPSAVPLRPQPWSLPLDLDPEWFAFEVYAEHAESDIEDDEVTVSEHAGGEDHHQHQQQQQQTDSRPFSFQRQSREPSLDPQLTTALAGLHLDGNSPASSNSNQQQLIHLPSIAPSSSTINFFGHSNSATLPIRTSLSLLEMLIRLTALQQFQQISHLSVPDELLNFFLSESSTTGAGGDSEERRRKRYEARRKVGFDPYDESPLKPRRGEPSVRDHDRAGDFSSEDWGGGGGGSEYGSSLRSPTPGTGAWQSSQYPSSRTYRASTGSPASPMLLRSRESVERDVTSPSIRRQQEQRPSPLRKSVSEANPLGKSGGMEHNSSVLPSVENVKGRTMVILRDEAGEGGKQQGQGQKRGSPLRKDATAENDQ